ncbi:MAG: non-canonical purine NTP pyrophosphatase, RdgB/HAM1 family, partial [Gammaproteobacteria bacterium CG22_combo_CG10-13_8_21_14_all_40_8]
MMKKQWVLASNNKGKLSEISAILSDLDIELIPQSQFGFSEAEETGLSFIENAIIKARHASQHTNLAAIADDSGIEIEALKGAPGIYSARYAGENATDEENLQKLLEDLGDSTERAARYVCVIAVVRHHLDPTPMIFEGYWEGVITFEKKGAGGFGYD